MEKSVFLKQASALLAGQLSKLALQAGYFVVIARLLGVDDFGAFAAVLAIAAIVGPFSNLGASVVMAKAVARDGTRSANEWSRTLVYTLIGGVVVTLVLAALSSLIASDRVSWGSLALIVVAEIIGVKMVENAAVLWQARGSSRALATLPSLVNLVRMLAALAVLVFMPAVSLATWSLIYFGCTMPVAIVVTIYTTRKIGWRRDHLAPSRLRVKEGLQYAVGLSSTSVHNDIDKTMLAALVAPASAGVYAAAYRLIDMAYAPVRAIAAASFPHLNREGAHGLASSLKIVRSLLPMVFGYGIGGATLLYLCAPVAPLILGDGYEESVSIIRLLAALLVTRGLTFLAADALTGSDYQGLRTLIQIVVALLNVVANFILLPVMGIAGAIITSIGSEVLLCCALWSTCFLITRREKSMEPLPESQTQNSR